MCTLQRCRPRLVSADGVSCRQLRRRAAKCGGGRESGWSAPRRHSSAGRANNTSATRPEMAHRGSPISFAPTPPWPPASDGRSRRPSPGPPAAAALRECRSAPAPKPPECREGFRLPAPRRKKSPQGSRQCAFALPPTGSPSAHRATAARSDRRGNATNSPQPRAF